MQKTNKCLHQPSLVDCPDLGRRKFLRQTLSSLGALAAFGPVVRAGEETTRLIPAIDTHVHFYDPTRPQGVPWPPKNVEVLYEPRLPEDFRKLTKGLAIAGVVVVEASPLVADNQWVLDLAKDNALIVGFIGHLKPGQPEFATNLKRLGANPLFRGLRFDQEMLAKGLGQRAFESDLKALAERGLSLDVVGGTAILPHLPRLAKLAPDLRVIIDHLPFRDWRAEPEEIRHALQEIAELPNIYAKISDVPRQANGRLTEDPAFYFPILDLLWNQFGAERTMFGSNWPVSDLFAPYATVHHIVSAWMARKETAVAEKFFWKNSLAAYHWQPRGEAAHLVAR
ncbi:MAG TPA: amidohydrolase family protein [Verrucomicrobiae bacterium]|nr:amidohydrolase family protein [Verrucomicrobiae bacterium]